MILLLYDNFVFDLEKVKCIAFDLNYQEITVSFSDSDFIKFQNINKSGYEKFIGEINKHKSIFNIKE